MRISVIICSRDARAAQWVVRNLRRTASQPSALEILVMENSQKPQGICAVYNQACHRVRGDVVVLMHEDAYMMEPGWDDVVMLKFAENARMGLLGVAGSSYLMSVPPLWSKAGPPYTFGKVTHELDGGREYFLTVLNPEDGDQRVVALDGVWLAVRKDVLNHFQFDSTTFPGFHFYDIDFCLQVSEKWELWATTDIRVKHLSAGDFGAAWLQAAEKLKLKWHAVLPLSLKPAVSASVPGAQRIQSMDLKGKVPQITLI